MAVTCLGGGASIVRLSFQLTDLPGYLQRGLETDATTIEVERAGEQLVSRNFPADLTADFVRRVCYCGGYAGVGGKVLKHNRISDISASMRRATLLTRQGNLKAALETMLGLKCLAVSFASKHLKFLDPTRHVVLDSIISERLGYPRTPDGYCEFIADCTELHKAVLAAGIVRPDNHPFRIADVEMAIFQILRSR